MYNNYNASLSVSINLNTYDELLMSVYMCSSYHLKLGHYYVNVDVYTCTLELNYSYTVLMLLIILGSIGYTAFHFAM